MSIYQCYQLMNNFEFIKTKFNQQNRNFKRKDREYTNKSFFPKQIYQSKSRRNPTSSKIPRIDHFRFSFIQRKHEQEIYLRITRRWLINETLSHAMSLPFFSLRRNFATRHSMRINRLDEQINKSMRVFLVFILHSFRTLFSFLLVIDKGGSVELISRKLSSPLAMRKTRTQNLPASREELSHCFRIYSFEQKLIVNCVLLTPSLDVIGN